MSDSKGVAIIDWFSFTLDGHFVDGSPAVFFRKLLQIWLGSDICGDQGNGLYGFKYSVTYSCLRLGELQPVAVVAWGGSNQRGKVYVSINGSGCSMINDWRRPKRFVQSVGATITRVDIAVDALNGEFSIDNAQEWYESNGFNNGGRNPLYSVVGDWLTPTGAGRTFYVGKRKNGKYARIYEKGKQLGNVDSKWTRFEIELHNRDREIPYDILSVPSEYFSGAYPCCEGLVEHGAQRIKTLRQEHDITLEQLKTYCRAAYGKLVNVLRISVTSSDEELRLLDDLTVEGVPRRLGKTSLTVLTDGGAAPPGIFIGDGHGYAI